MLRAYGWRDGRLQTFSQDDASEAIWFDLEKPSAEEYAFVTRVTGFSLPHYADLSEIESSSRLSVDAGVLTLSLPVVTRIAGVLENGVCGFVLSPERLVTLRFAPSVLFNQFTARAPAEGVPGSVHIFVALLEGIVDRLADALEKLREELDKLSHKIFHHRLGSRTPARNAERELQRILVTLGQDYDSISYLRDSQLGVARIAPYVLTAVEWIPKTLRERLKSVQKDVSSLNEFSTHLTDKVQFLLDSTLGFINIAQNSLIKVLTIVSIMGIPPTLIAGIYGMNFHDIPELTWKYGYGFAWALMIISAVAPLVWFRKKGWI
ncbi:magnesium transporter CorA family protein [Acidocella aminolytica]|jgi:magnesium transporter|uniref:Magnesium transport protein CorA n=1 Tax=Acidocella aminolytica 101 = DSM 11237 TaxID=1120923 RepID=A0A0D6PLM5_9PROT|nr:magnesium transporter CorA family protein [Acidocella aminolytica]GAN81684.1 magnesium/cobalt transporter CorA [Acidocella aminolytica 101 = DSM 11237]GBQ32918.1 Mg2+ and Co2+ transporter [Acidocella aminolytica 101 = DSM 11237]SHE50661.1 magnesium transporter [Acidocella aminolytica 101 = DSM 11237]